MLRHACLALVDRWRGRWDWKVAAALLVLAFAAPAQAREVRVGVYGNPPKLFQGPQGELSGILGELLTAIAAREGWTVQPVPCEWRDCLAALQDGRIDLMPDVALTEQRREAFDFHELPSLSSWSQLYRRRDVDITSMLDLRGMRIAVVAGSVQREYLSNVLAGFAIQAELVDVQSFGEGFEWAEAGRVDAAAANRFFGDLHATDHRLVPTPVMFQPARLFYAAGKGRNADLLVAIDRRLREWQARSDSPYFAVMRRWTQPSGERAVPVAAWWALGGLGTLLLMAVGVGAWLRQEVARKTRDLRDSEDRLATILNSVDAGIYIKDAERRYRYANRSLCELLGRAPEDVVGRRDEDFFEPAVASRLRENDLRVLQHAERVEVEETNGLHDGVAERVFLSVKLPLRTPEGSVHALCGISTDITRHKRSEQAIHQLAFYDALTGLPNRRLLLERLRHTLAGGVRDGRCGALLFIDIDNFKDLNDTLGHEVGDQLLCEVAHRLQGCLRARDTVARLGGDEFVVMIEDLGQSMDEATQQAGAVARKLLARVSEAWEVDGQRRQVTASIGVAMFGDPRHDQDELFRQADLAMYQAKADGRNAVSFFGVEMQARVNARTQLEADLRRALERSEFLLHYQPQVDAQGEWRGVEALVRWQHPTRGMVPPAAFIAVAESSGLILPLGRWILDRACRQLRAWRDEGGRAALGMSVNVSARQFRQHDFVQEVESILNATGADPHRLKLELTESELLDDVDAVVAKMQALRALGVGLSLDDFGTGYSSLSLLKRLPLDQVKIDRTFVRDILTDAQDASIVEAVVLMGRGMGIEVIAEGVETTEQRDALVRLGCRLFQGYLFGRPGPLAPDLADAAAAPRQPGGRAEGALRDG